jgi:hypothetical protein
VVDKQHMRINAHSRVQAYQVIGSKPVGCCRETIQETRRGERERPDARGGEPSAAGMRGLQRGDDRFGNRAERVRHPRHDHGVSLRESFQTELSSDCEGAGVNLWSWCADPHSVRRTPVREASPPEHLNGYR